MKEKNTLKKYITNIISFANSRTRNVYRNRASEFYNSPVTDDLRELNRSVWQSVVGYDKEILTVRFFKSKSDKTLGISLYGQVIMNDQSLTEINPDAFNDLNCTEETIPARHYIKEIKEDTPIGSLPYGSVEVGDELLQANGLRIWGVSFKRAIRSLRTLPSYIELVLARSKVPIDTDDYISREYELLHVAASEVNSICTNDENPGPYHVSDTPFPQRRPSLIDTMPKSRVDTFKWIQESLCHPTSTDIMNEDEEELNNLNNQRLVWKNDCESLDAKQFDKIDELDSCRASLGNIEKFKFSKNLKWSTVPLIIQMKKDAYGFGFSIAEYEEMVVSNVDDVPRHASTLKRDSRSSYVTLAKKGKSIEADGFHPDAGRSLRSSPRHSLGRRESLGNQTSNYNTMPNRRRSTQRTSSLPNTKEYSYKPTVLLIDSIMKDGAAYRDGRLCIGDRLLFVNDRKLEHASQSDAVNALRSAPQGPVIIGVRKMLMDKNPPVNLPEQEYIPEEQQVKNVEEKSITNHKLLDFDHEDNHHTKYPEIHERILQFEPVSTSFERDEEIDREDKPLGLKLDALVNGGIDGCRVIQILRKGAISEFSKIQPDDYITQINKYSLRYRDNVQVFQILRKVLHDNRQVHLKYIRSDDIDRHRTNPNNKITNVNRYNEFKSLKRSLVTKFSTETSWGLRFANEIPVDGDQEMTKIEKVIYKSPAERVQRINVNDIILEVNGHNFRGHNYESIVDYIKENSKIDCLDLLLQSSSPQIDNKFPIMPQSKIFLPNGIFTQKSMEKSCYSDSGRFEEPSPVSECETKDILNVMSAIVESENNFSDCPTQRSYVKKMENIQGPVLIDTEFEDSSNEINEFPIDYEDGDEENLDQTIMPPPPDYATLQRNEPSNHIGFANLISEPDHVICEIMISLTNAPSGDHSENLGLELVGSRDPQKKATIIHAIKPNSLASRENIKVGDEIIEVNEVNVINMNHTYVQSLILKSLYNRKTLHLLLSRNTVPTSSSPVSPLSSNQQVGFKEFSDGKAEENFEEFMEKFTVTLDKGDQGYGLHIVNSGINDESGVFIKAITENSPASECKLFKNYDQILKVDDVTINDYDTALQCVKDKKRIVLVMARKSKRPITKTDNHKMPNDSETNQKQSQIPVSSSADAKENVDVGQKKATIEEVPKVNSDIKEGVPTEIILQKENNSLGFSIVGGKETILGSIMIHEIYENSVAAKDGRLWCADRIMAINDVDITNFDHSKASNLIKSSPDTVKLKILRLPKLKTDDLEIVKVKLDRKQGRGLGLSIGYKPNDATGAVIVEILNNSPACKSGRLLAGDIILKVDDMDVTRKSPEDVIAKLKTLKGEVNLEVGRPKLGLYPGIRSKVRLFEITLISKVNSVGEFDFGLHFLEFIHGIHFRDATETEYNTAKCKLLVDYLEPKSYALKTCSIQPFDRLYAIDDEPVDWLTAAEVEILLTLDKNLNLTFGRVFYHGIDIDQMITNISGDQLLVVQQPQKSINHEAEESICKNVQGFQLNTPNEEDENSLESQASTCNSSADKNNQAADSISLEMSQNNLVDPRTSNAFQKMIQISIPPKFTPNEKTPLGIRLEYEKGPSGPRISGIEKGSPADESNLCVGDRIFVVQNIMFHALIEEEILNNDETPSSEALTTILEDFWYKAFHDPLNLFVVMNDRRSSVPVNGRYDKKVQNGYQTMPRSYLNSVGNNVSSFIRNKTMTLERSKNLPDFSKTNGIHSYN